MPEKQLELVEYIEKNYPEFNVIIIPNEVMTKGEWNGLRKNIRQWLEEEGFVAEEANN